MSSPVPECDVDVLKVILDEDAIAGKVAELGSKIATDYADLKPVLLPVMTGAFVFSADLVRAIRPPPQGMLIESIRASSYLGTTTISDGEVAIAPLSIDVKGRHVLLVEDPRESHGGGCGVVQARRAAQQTGTKDERAATRVRGIRVPE
jgi:hypoxanthine phosphoribosyltransferase